MLKSLLCLSRASSISLSSSSSSSSPSSSPDTTMRSSSSSARSVFTTTHCLRGMMLGWLVVQKCTAHLIRGHTKAVADPDLLLRHRAHFLPPPTASSSSSLPLVVQRFLLHVVLLLILLLNEEGFLPSRRGAVAGGVAGPASVPRRPGCGPASSSSEAAPVPGAEVVGAAGRLALAHWRAAGRLGGSLGLVGPVHLGSAAAAAAVSAGSDTAACNAACNAAAVANVTAAASEVGRPSSSSSTSSSSSDGRSVLRPASSSGAAPSSRPGPALLQQLGAFVHDVPHLQDAAHREVVDDVLAQHPQLAGVGAAQHALEGQRVHRCRDGDGGHVLQQHLAGTYTTVRLENLKFT
ncbi:hypothetical protein EYF80_053430 [Liparis tanakae]|uniref:Uncharacterized protein n=1 Tax=Liparis tanakae TaxID=230148 RepID=A0A4Z2F5L3_9TELE|nr:hypothetical protein EYF80_053430 [Liparis tanakae]